MKTWQQIMPGRIKAQAIIEYSLFLALFMAVLLAMQIYLKRSFQGSLKRSTDTFSGGEQFSPALSNYTKVVKSSSQVKQTINPQGETRVESVSPEIILTEPFKDDFSDKKLTEESLF